jgi:hypothetical protein
MKQTKEEIIDLDMEIEIISPRLPNQVTNIHKEEGF